MAKISEIPRYKWLGLPRIENDRDHAQMIGIEYFKTNNGSTLFFDYKKWREFGRICAEIDCMKEYFDRCIQLDIGYAPLILRGITPSPSKVYNPSDIFAENSLYVPIFRCDFAGEYMGKKLCNPGNSRLYPACFFSTHDPDLEDMRRVSPIITKLHRDGI
jgi:hypothetical protein